jgi:hypothetical protein
VTKQIINVVLTKELDQREDNNLKVWRLHAAIHGIYYFSYIEQTGSETHCMELVLRHNGGFCNTCTLKRCLHRKVDFKTNATYNAHVSQLFPLQSRIVTKGLYYFILSNQNKLVEIRCSHKKCLLFVLHFEQIVYENKVI